MKTPMTREEAASIINQITSKAGKDLQVQPAEVHIGEKVIILGGANDRAPSELFNMAFPGASGGKYHHYTGYSKFESILGSGKLRLYNLHKRFDDGEFRTFCEDHGLDGYLRTEAQGDQVGDYNAIMDDLFYTSFVAAGHSNEQRFWDVFADSGKGVRLEFVIKPDRSWWLRQVAYQQPNNLPLVKDLFDAFDRHGYKFVPLGLSRMGALYQPKEYNWETEIRMFTKRFPEEPFPFRVIKESADPKDRIAYVEFDLLGSNPLGIKLQLTGVLPGPNCDRGKVDSYLKGPSAVKGVDLLK